MGYSCQEERTQRIRDFIRRKVTLQTNMEVVKEIQNRRLEAHQKLFLLQGEIRDICIGSRAESLKRANAQGVRRYLSNEH